MSRPSFRAFRADTSGEQIARGVVTMTTDDLADDGVLVEVHWSLMSTQICTLVWLRPLEKKALKKSQTGLKL
jgi:hypothetical protein